MDSRRMCRLERNARPVVQDDVLADQRAVEIARDRLDVARKVGGKDQPDGFVRKSTSALIWAGGRLLNVLGITSGKPFWM